MGWFDKKSWRLRRKIKDLQADLRDAEREGKFVVEQGLFFAELEDMGEMTMMVFGTTDVLASQEESVIRAFFDRNGFAVEQIKLDKDRTGLAAIEIIPPEEMVKIVGRALKSEGFRVVDDSERERQSDLEKKVYTLSSLVRAISIMFSQRVQDVISTTALKMNKEGNRLLHWMPKIVETLKRKLSTEVLEVARPGFDAAYDQLFRSIGQGPAPVVDKAKQADRERIPMAGGRPAAPVIDEATPVIKPTLRSLPDSLPPIPVRSTGKAPESGGTGGGDLYRAMRRKDIAEMTARMLKSLIHATPNRCVHNSELILAEINTFYRAAATCLMVKIPHGKGLTIHAQAGTKLTWSESGEGDGFAVSSQILATCIKTREAVIHDGRDAGPSSSMVKHHISTTAAVPIFHNDDIVAILYVDRRDDPQPFTKEDCAELAEISTVFKEFPDLTLGLLD